MSLPVLPLQPESAPEVLLPKKDAPKRAFRLGVDKVSAGFPSPAADYEDKRLDINDFLVRNPVSTFFFPVQGDSMQGAEIFDGDILVVDKSVEPAHGHIVVAFVSGERLVKRLHKRDGRVSLVAENPKYPAITVTEAMEVLIWGVVVGKFKRVPA
jgi:DNA polymerase V